VLLDGSDPLGVFTGGALLSGSVARTDLLTPEQTEPLARALFHSIRERLFALPDELPVYPTHGAGATFCAIMSTRDGDPSTTIGRERSVNALLRAPDEEAFARELIASYGSYPRYFTRLREVNRRGPRTYGAVAPTLAPLAAIQAREAVADGVEIVDARPIEGFATGHISGSLSIPLRPAFGTWLGWLVPEDKPLVFVLADDQDRADVVRQCLMVGYERLVGDVVGGMGAWEEAGLPTERLPLADPDEAPEGTVLDVRQRSEFEHGHVPGAVHVELGSLEAAVSSLPAGPLTTQCGHGERAMSAASLLRRAGRTDVTVLRGGPDDLCRVSGRRPARGTAP
jgi:hydroxyacylglutathione hydrolase